MSIKIVSANGNVENIIPTHFPDGTSQVWKLNLDYYRGDLVTIIWNFSEEAELIWINQLVDLLWVEGINISELYIPYLPYGRQDKAISNEATFAKSTFFKLLPENVLSISSLDMHSLVGSGSYRPIKNYTPYEYIARAIIESSAEVLVFPDAGAYSRYSSLFPSYTVIVLDKVREQSTGKITGLTLDETLTDMEWWNGQKFMSNVPKLLIVDDICDGGQTFINASLFLHDRIKCDISLYVTHGIFSKGYERLIDSGISGFYTTQSLTRNTLGYKLLEIKNVI